VCVLCRVCTCTCACVCVCGVGGLVVYYVRVCGVCAVCGGTNLHLSTIQ
jgi:hypothetical protein